jgi:hypothetical protein
MENELSLVSLISLVIFVYGYICFTFRVIVMRINFLHHNLQLTETGNV